MKQKLTLDSVLQDIHINLATATFQNNTQALYNNLKTLERVMRRDTTEKNIDEQLHILDEIDTQMSKAISQYELSKLQKRIAKNKAIVASIPLIDKKARHSFVSTAFNQDNYERGLQAITYHEERIQNKEHLVDNLGVFIDQQKIFEQITPGKSKELELSKDKLNIYNTQFILEMAMTHQSRMMSTIKEIFSNSSQREFFIEYFNTSNIEYTLGNIIDRSNSFIRAYKMTNPSEKKYTETLNNQYKLVKNFSEISEDELVNFNTVQLAFTSANTLQILWRIKEGPRDVDSPEFFDIYQEEQKARETFQKTYNKLTNKLKHNGFINATNHSISHIYS